VRINRSRSVAADLDTSTRASSELHTPGIHNEVFRAISQGAGDRATAAINCRGGEVSCRWLKGYRRGPQASRQGRATMPTIAAIARVDRDG
jgi:hypothetical protein